jgi:spore germination protein
MNIHVVRSGETLWSISNLYGVNINRIIQTNKLTNPDLLAIGESLVIPTPPTNVHIVKPGETLFIIASKHGTSVQQLIRDNNLTNTNMIYPGQILYINKPFMEVNGYLGNIGPRGQEIFLQVASDLTYITPFSYQIRSDGSLVPINDSDVLKIAKNTNTSALLVITNFQANKFSSSLAHDFLNNPTAINTFLNNLIIIMRTKGYSGLNVDFEYVLPEDRNAYNSFLAVSANRLHQNGYSLSTALAPKISANQPGLLYEAHDYAAHGKIVDFVMLMTYEWGWTGGPPLAIAPLNEVKRVLDYAVTAIPRNKILMGVPLYGRDWKLPFVAGQSFAQTVTPVQAVDLAIKYGSIIKYNVLYQSPYFNYRDEQGFNHEVWYEDARSVQAKYTTAIQYRLRGVSYWELSSTFPQNWPVLEYNFQIKKVV